MAHIIGDRCRETSTTIGTGTYSLAGAVLGFQDFDTLAATNDLVFYFAAMGADWEVGRGTFTSGSPDTLARTTIYASSNGGAAVSWAAGIKEITGTIPARFMELLNTIEIAVASATTCDIGAVNGSHIEITGVTAITSFGIQAHKRRYVRFSGALLLTHNATSLILPGGVNIVTAPGDTAVFVSDGSGNWRCWNYTEKGAAFKAGSFTRDMTTASGSQAITGVGFKPRAVIFFAVENGAPSMSVGMVDLSLNQNAVADANTVSTDTYANVASAAIYAQDAAAASYSGAISSLDADGFTVSWTRTSTPSGTLTVNYLAIR